MGKRIWLDCGGEEVVPAYYSEIKILNPYWIVALDKSLGDTVFYHMDDDKVSYMRMGGRLLDYDYYNAQEEYLNVEVDDKERVTLGAGPMGIEVVQRTISVYEFNGLTEISALKQELKEVYGENTSVTDEVTFWGCGLETNYVLVSIDSGTEHAVVDKEGNLVLPFSKSRVKDYSNGYFLLSGDDGSQFVRKDGTLTGEANDPLLPYGIAAVSEMENGTYLLEAADGTKTECGAEELMRTGQVGKLWIQRSSGDYALLDWHGNVLLEHWKDWYGQVSTDEKFLLANGKLYAVDGASVNDVVATAN